MHTGVKLYDKFQEHMLYTAQGRQTLSERKIPHVELFITLL